MTSRTHVMLAGAFAFAMAAPDAARAETADGAKPLVLAQGPLSEEEKAKRKERKAPPPARQAPPPPGPRQGPPPGQPGKVLQAPPPQPGRSAKPSPDGEPQPYPRRAPSAQPSRPPPSPSGQPPSPFIKQQPPPKATQPLEPRRGPDGQREPWKREVSPKQPGPPPGTSAPRSEPTATQPVEPRKGPDGKREPWKREVSPKQPGPAPDAGSPPKFVPKGPGPVSPPAAGSPPAFGGPARVAPGPRAPDVAAPRLIDVQKARTERVEGNRRVIVEPGNRTIIREGNRVVIRHDDADRFRRGGRDVRVERRPDGHTQTFYMRPDGVRIVTVVDGHGRMVRRYRHYHDGREVHIIDNRRFLRNVAIGVGIGAVAGVALIALAPPRVTIAREKYIVDYYRASDDDLYEALSAPPVEELERGYSLDEIRDNYELRQRMRHIELGNITFEFGAWEVTPDQYPKLERLARAILRVLERNPDEVFLIEGHTDAVGSDVDNLSLSDRRASSVAEILSETFGVPPENLVTQGYGEQFLKVPTPGPEPLNRRVYARRISPLMAER